MQDKTQIKYTITQLTRTSNRMGIYLVALNWLQSDKSLTYYKHLDKEDLSHNLDNFFVDIRTIHELLMEELVGLRDLYVLLEDSKGA